MRHPVSVLLIVTGSFLLGLAGCAGDSMKSSQRAAEDASKSAVAQGKGAQGEPSGEIQERGLVPLPRPNAPATAATDPPPPNPIIAFVTKERTPILGNYTYDFQVINAAAFPAWLFAISPNLPPCGTIVASRTWSYWVSQDGKWSSEMTCGIDLSTLGQAYIGFGFPTSMPAPSPVAFVLWDRLTNSRYVSNWVTIPGPGVFLAPVAPRMPAPVMPRGIEGDQPAEPPPGTPEPAEQPSGKKSE